MSGGGSKPRGGKIGTSIRSMTVSAEGIANAEKELAALANKLNDVRQRMMDSARRYQASEKTVAALEMELAKSQKEVMLSSKSERYFSWICWYWALTFFTPFIYRLTA